MPNGFMRPSTAIPAPQVTLGSGGSNYVNPSGPASSVAPTQISATGSGPFDPQYRQNLAVYGGGQFAPPSSNWAFNPTNLGSSFGNPTGGGNAPVAGMPTTLLAQALGGNPFYTQSPSTQASQSGAQPGAQSSPTQTGQWNWLPAWLQQYLSSGMNLTPGTQGQG